MGEEWKTSKKQCSFRNREHWIKKKPLRDL